MHSLHRRRARSTPALIASLAQFLMGSNYCVLSALSGNAGMACLMMPGDASSAPVPACHAAAPASDHDADEPAAASSCCPDPVVAPIAPVLEKADGAFMPLADAVLASILVPASPTAVDRHGQPVAPDAEPPPRFTHAPSPARAPPLA